MALRFSPAITPSLSRPLHMWTMAPSPSPQYSSEFRHDPLPDSATHIRLLEVLDTSHHPNDDDDDDDKDDDDHASVRCRLTAWPVDSAPPYHAISYTWGDPGPHRARHRQRPADGGPAELRVRAQAGPVVRRRRRRRWWRRWWRHQPVLLGRCHLHRPGQPGGEGAPGRHDLGGGDPGA